MASTRLRRLAPLLSLGLALAAGCGSKAPSPEAAAATLAGPTLRLLHAFDERGDQPRGRFTAVAVEGEQILAGTEDGLEVFAYDETNGFQSQAHHALRAGTVSPSRVQRIRRGRGEDLWVSGTDGLARFQGVSFKLQEQSGPARDAADFDGIVWIARSNGLEVYQPELPKLSEMPIVLHDGAETSELTGTRQPLSACTVAPDVLLLGTQFGLLKVQKANNSLQWNHLYGPWDRVAGNNVLPQEGNCSLPGNRVLNLRLSPDGKQVALCTDGGLAVVDLPEMKSWTTYQGTHRVNRSDPIRGIYHEEIPGEVAMPSSDVLDVAFGERHLFLGTKKGLVVVSREGPKAMAAQVIGLDEGLPSSQVNGLALDPTRGILFVATQYGLAAYKLGP